MRKLLMILALPAIALSLVLFQPNSTEAAPGLLDAGKAVTEAANPLVLNVHGCHRRARRGPWSGVWHRHAGPYCIWTPKASPCKQWRKRCRQRCFDSYKPGKCFRRCFVRNAPRFCH